MGYVARLSSTPRRRRHVHTTSTRLGWLCRRTTPHARRISGQWSPDTYLCSPCWSASWSSLLVRPHSWCSTTQASTQKIRGNRAHVQVRLEWLRKAYGTLNHLNAHVTMQSHGQKRTPEEFKEIRKEWKARKKEEENQRKAEDERARATVVPADGQNSSDNTPAGYQQ